MQKQQYDINRNKKIVSMSILLLHIIFIQFMPLSSLHAQSNSSQNKALLIKKLKDSGVKKLSLTDCIQTALRENPRFVIYRKKLVQSKEKLNEANTALLPKIDLNASYDRLSYVTQQKKRYLGNSNNDYQAGIYLNQPLLSGGRISADRKTAQLGIEISQIEYRAEELAVAYAVKTAYFKMLHATAMLESAQDLLRYAEYFYAEAAALYQRTKMPRFETLLQIRVQRDAAKMEVLRAETGVEIAGKDLLNAMGLSSRQPIAIVTIKDEFSSSPVTADAIVNNPEILRIKKYLSSAAEAINSAQSGYSPQVSARAGYKYEWGNLPGNSEWYAGFTVSMPLSDLIRTRAEVNRMRAYREGIAAEASLIKKNILLKIESALLKYETGKKRLFISKANLRNAGQSLRMMQIRHRRAALSNLELLEAQRLYARAQADYAGVILEIRLALAEIDYVTGAVYGHK